MQFELNYCLTFQAFQASQIHIIGMDSTNNVNVQHQNSLSIYSLYVIYCALPFLTKLFTRRPFFYHAKSFHKVLDFCQFEKDADNERYNDNIALQML